MCCCCPCSFLDGTAMCFASLFWFSTSMVISGRQCLTVSCWIKGLFTCLHTTIIVHWRKCLILKKKWQDGYCMSGNTHIDTFSWHKLQLLMLYCIHDYFSAIHFRKYTLYFLKFSMINMHHSMFKGKTDQRWLFVFVCPHYLTFIMQFFPHCCDIVMSEITSFSLFTSSIWMRTSPWFWRLLKARILASWASVPSKNWSHLKILFLKSLLFDKQEPFWFGVI